MATDLRLDVSIDRKPVGEITISKNSTIGDVIIKILSSFENQLKVQSEPTKIVNNPPSYCDLSILILAPHNRFMRAFNLSQIKNFRSINLSAPVQRKGKLVGDENKSDINDIAYDRMASIHLFTFLSDWSQYLIRFEEMHHQALINHHNFCKTKDMSYRQNNQSLRRQLADLLNTFLTMEPRSPLPNRPLYDFEQTIQHHNSSNRNSSNHTSSDQNSSNRNSSNHNSSNRNSSNHNSSNRNNSSNSDVNAYNRSNFNSLLASISDPSRSIPLTNSNHQTESRIINYRQEGDTTEDDYKSALELFMELNPGQTIPSGHDTIQRLIKAGIAKDALGPQQ